MSRSILDTRERRAFVDVLKRVVSSPHLIEGAYEDVLEEHLPRRPPAANGSEDEEEGVQGRAVELAEGPRGGGLFPYQQELVDEATDVVSGPAGSRVGLVALPTGSGKTRVAVTTCLRQFARGCRRMLWVAPTTELLEQALSA